MTPEAALWVLGVAVAPVIGWAIHVTFCVLTIARKVESLTQVLAEPEKNGFGTLLTNKVIEDNTHAVEALTHYIKWLATHTSGEKPPPPL